MALRRQHTGTVPEFPLGGRIVGGCAAHWEFNYREKESSDRRARQPYQPTLQMIGYGRWRLREGGAQNEEKSPVMEN